VKADSLSAELADKKHRLARGFVDSHCQLVVFPGFFQGLPHLGLGREKAVGRHGVVQALVRAEMVVVVDKSAKARLGLGEFQGFGPAPELLAHGLPEPLAFAEGFGVVGAGDHVPYALLVQQPLELARAAPSVVLPALVGEQFLGLSKTLDAFKQGFHDEVRGLLQPQLPGHHVTAVVVHEGDQIHSLPVTRKHETGDVALPQFARPGPFKAPDNLPFLPVFFSGLAVWEAFFPDHPPNLRLAGLQAFETG
jgi:hypothetical protein